MGEGVEERREDKLQLGCKTKEINKHRNIYISVGLKERCGGEEKRRKGSKQILE